MLRSLFHTLATGVIEDLFLIPVQDGVGFAAVVWTERTNPEAASTPVCAFKPK